VRAYSFTVIEHDPAKPWIVGGQERRTVDLADGRNFFEWAHRAWPEPRFTVQLDPYQDRAGN
jgi:hypothetical protein